MKLTKKFVGDFNLGIGEASVIALAVNRNIPLIADDNRCRKVGKVLGLEILSSLDFPIILYKKDAIDYEKAKICMEIMKKEGWFGEGVLAEYSKYLSNIEGDRK